MNFRPELAARVMSGEKTATRRLVSDNPASPWWKQACGYTPNQWVAVCPGRGKHNIGHARVTSVQLQRLGEIDAREAAREGFDSADAFQAAWTKINGTYDPDALVWRIGLEAIR